MSGTLLVAVGSPDEISQLVQRIVHKLAELETKPGEVDLG